MKAILAGLAVASLVAMTPAAPDEDYKVKVVVGGMH